MYCAWKDSGNRTGDTDTPIQEAKHRLINEAGKNDEIMSVTVEREIGPPRFELNRPVVRASSFREHIFCSRRGHEEASIRQREDTSIV